MCLPDLRGRAEPIDARDHDLKDHDLRRIGVLVGQDIGTLQPVLDRRDPIALLAKLGFEYPSAFGLVVGERVGSLQCWTPAYDMITNRIHT